MREGDRLIKVDDILREGEEERGMQLIKAIREEERAKWVRRRVCKEESADVREYNYDKKVL